MSKTVTIPTSPRLLVREYIQRSLYDPMSGYFSNSLPPVLEHKVRPRLQDIPSRNAYQKFVARTYSGAEHGWMTPVELFSPHLSRSIANRVQSVSSGEKEIHIIEVGAGRGTLARDILEYWSKTSPDLLRRVSYNLVEISSPLAQLQAIALKPWIERGIASVHVADALMWFDGLLAKPRVLDRFRAAHCHVLGTEILDNLPHDLIRAGEKGLEQAEVVPYSGETYISRNARLEWLPDIDPVTSAAMQAYGIVDADEHGKVSSSLAKGWIANLRDHFEQLLDGGTREIWVPTVSYGLIRALVAALPHAHLTIGDFDSFPGSLSGQNGPVVQSVERGSAVIYDSVQGAPFGKVDIMFPTDFTALQQGHNSVCQGSGHGYVRRTLSQQQFFEEYSSEEDKSDSTCQDGYNPILQDFENASFMLVDHVGS